MKVLIEISEEDYLGIKDPDRLTAYWANIRAKEEIRKGTPISDNATNGDVIKAIFPNLEIEYTDIDEYTNKPRYVKLIVGDTIITRMSADRWDAPYKGGE